VEILQVLEVRYVQWFYVAPELKVPLKKEKVYLSRMDINIQ